jgi:phosphate:Na+ symporter
LLERLVPSKEFKETPRLTDLDVRMLDTPTLAIEQSHKELERMGDGCEKMLRWVGELRDQEQQDTSLANEVIRREAALDSIQDEISAYITKLLSGTVPHLVADEARRQLRMADDYESVSDYVADLERFDRKLRRAGLRFTESQRQGLDELNSELLNYLESVNTALRQNNVNILEESAPAAKRIRSTIKRFRRQHLEDLSDGNIPPSVNVAVLASLNAYVRVLDHGENIAESISGEK